MGTVVFTGLPSRPLLVTLEERSVLLSQFFPFTDVLIRFPTPSLYLTLSHPLPVHFHPTFSLPQFLPHLFVSPQHLSFLKKSIERAIRFANERAENREQREPEPKREQV